MAKAYHKLCARRLERVAVECCGGIEYAVLEGDTCDGVAALFAVAKRDLLAWNAGERRRLCGLAANCRPGNSPRFSFVLWETTAALQLPRAPARRPARNRGPPASHAPATTALRPHTYRPTPRTPTTPLLLAPPNLPLTRLNLTCNGPGPRRSCAQTSPATQATSPPAQHP